MTNTCFIGEKLSGGGEGFFHRRTVNQFYNVLAKTGGGGDEDTFQQQSLENGTGGRSRVSPVSRGAPVMVGTSEAGTELPLKEIKSDQRRSHCRRGVARKKGGHSPGRIAPNWTAILPRLHPTDSPLCCAVLLGILGRSWMTPCQQVEIWKAFFYIYGFLKNRHPLN